MKRSPMHRLSVVISIFSFLLAMVLSGAAGASTSTRDDHVDHHNEATPAAGSACSTTFDQASNPGSMMPGTAMARMPMTVEFDLMFIDMMIPHHQSAIAMAKVALERGEHQEVLDLAQAIVTSQQAEIDQMRAWRDSWYPHAPTMPMDQMNQMMGNMMSGMPHMMATPGAGMGSMGMMDPHAELQALCESSEPFDQTFLEMMIPHHQTAVVMAEVALQQAVHAELKTLARQILNAQLKEISQMQGWLAEWNDSTTSGTPVASTVEVTLSDFAIEMSQTEFQVGETYRFVVTNQGMIAHEFMIIPHMKGAGSMEMEALDAVAMGMIPASDLAPGQTQSLEVTFTESQSAGMLEVVCAVPGHYDAGMRLPITIP